MGSQESWGSTDEWHLWLLAVGQASSWDYQAYYLDGILFKLPKLPHSRAAKLQVFKGQEGEAAILWLSKHSTDEEVQHRFSVGSTSL